jgi:hypothetical protein
MPLFVAITPGMQVTFVMIDAPAPVANRRNPMREIDGDGTNPPSRGLPAL